MLVEAALSPSKKDIAQRRLSRKTGESWDPREVAFCEIKGPNEGTLYDRK